MEAVVFSLDNMTLRPNEHAYAKWNECTPKIWQGVQVYHIRIFKSMRVVHFKYTHIFKVFFPPSNADELSNPWQVVLHSFLTVNIVIKLSYQNINLVLILGGSLRIILTTFCMQ